LEQSLQSWTSENKILLIIISLILITLVVLQGMGMFMIRLNNRTINSSNCINKWKRTHNLKLLWNQTVRSLLLKRSSIHSNSNRTIHCHLHRIKSIIVNHNETLLIYKKKHNNSIHNSRLSIKQEVFRETLHQKELPKMTSWHPDSP